MAGSATRKIEKIVKSILIIVSLLFALFLILLGDKIIEDIGSVGGEPEMSEFVDVQKEAELTTRQNQLNEEIENLENNYTVANQTMESAKNQYAQKNKAYLAWLNTRSVTGNPQENKELRKKTEELEIASKQVLEWTERSRILKNAWNEKEKERDQLANALSTVRMERQNRWSSAYRVYQLKVFFWRLLFILPLLLLALYLVFKFRSGRFAPFIWGYTIFALWSFFFGLVPYLPSFGGYIQYILGIALTFVVGYYVIRYIQSYLAEKQREEKLSSEERKEKIGQVIALTSYTNKVCPSCERSFMLGVTKQDKLPCFCIHCGLELFSDCENCGEINFIHFDYCWNCGTSLKKQHPRQSVSEGGFSS